MAELNRAQADSVFNSMVGYTSDVYAETLATNDYAIKTATPTEGIWTRYRLTIPDGETVPYLQDVSWRFHSVRVPVDDAGITYSGSWFDYSGTGGLAGESFKRSSNAAGEYAEWVSPATTGVVVHTGHISVGGLSKIYVDGSSTACNGLSTAQDMVDRGWYANTILVANGGTLDPDDRVINHSRDGYEAYGGIPRGHLVAYGLSNTTHTVRIECTGYDGLFFAAGSPRTYLWGFGVITEPDTAGADEWIFREGARVLSADPSLKPSRMTQEYAIRWTPDVLETSDWSGQSHLNENFVSLAVTQNTSSQFQLTRNTQFTHPEGVGTYCDAETVFTWGQGGLRIDNTFTWTQVAYMTTAYLAMQTMYSGEHYEYTSLEKLRGSAERSTETIDNNDDVEHLVGEARTMWMYGGNFVAALRVTDDHVIGAESRIWDRTRTNDEGYDKTYIARHVSASNVPVAVNEVWNSTAYHRFTFDPLGAANTAEQFNLPTKPYLELDTHPASGAMWVIAAEQYSARRSPTEGTPDRYTWEFQNSDPATGYLGNGFMRVLPDDNGAVGHGANTDGAIQPQMDYTFISSVAGTAYVWCRGAEPTSQAAAAEQPRTWMNGNYSGRKFPSMPVSMGWCAAAVSFPIVEGENTFTMGMYYSGLRFDSLIITTDATYNPNDDVPEADALALSSLLSTVGSITGSIIGSVIGSVIK